MTPLARYPVPTKAHRVEDVVSRSRFITTVGPASSAESARSFIDEIKSEFADATHNCWAFAVGPPGDTAAIGMSDDGEPHGTAGRPMLNVLLHSDVGEVVAVVTRYFGGVKLGRGGLVRAYSGGVGHAMRELPVVLKVDRIDVTVSVGYESVEPLKRLIAEYEVIVQDEAYGEAVTFKLAVPSDVATDFEDAVAGATNGQARVESGGAAKRE